MYIEHCRIKIGEFGVKNSDFAPQIPTLKWRVGLPGARGAIRGLFSQHSSTVKPPNII